jgi:hypothetical protein
VTHPDDWAQDLYEKHFVEPFKDRGPVDLPPGMVHCLKCKGTGIGAPGEKYYEMGVGTFGCSECNSYGYEPPKSSWKPSPVKAVR